MTLQPDNIDQHFVQILGSIAELLEKEENERIEGLCSKFIDNVKPIINNLLWEDEIKLNRLFGQAILIKAILDFVELIYLNQTENWIKSNDQVEEVWIRMCDCSDRVRFFKRLKFQNHPSIVEVIENNLLRLENYINSSYGNGIYSSIGLLKQGRICSICRKDITKCNHDLGEIYHGRLCKLLHKNIKVIEVSILKTPKDPRCRIWPWNITDDLKISGYAYRFFELDDFLKE